MSCENKVIKKNYEYTLVDAILKGKFNNINLCYEEDYVLFSKSFLEHKDIHALVSRYYLFRDGSEYVWKYDQVADLKKYLSKICPEMKDSYKLACGESPQCVIDINSTNIFIIFKFELNITLTKDTFILFDSNFKQHDSNIAQKTDWNLALDYIYSYLVKIMDRKKDCLSLKNKISTLLLKRTSKDLTNLTMEYIDTRDHYYFS